MQTAADVDALYADGKNYNLGLEPEDVGLAVIDADIYHTGCDLAAEHLPDTFVVETPRHGEHHYFVGSVPSTVGNPAKRTEGRLGNHIDTRGRGGFVVLPPSEIIGEGAGKYVIKHNRGYATIPLEIEARLASRVVSASASDAPAELRDTPGNIARGRSRLHDLVRRGCVARIGHFGHDLTYEVAVELVRDLGLSVETTLALMLEIWYPHCTPNDDPEFVRERVESCVTSGQNAIGANATAPAAETFAGFNLPVASPLQPAQRSPFYALGTVDQLELPDPEWLIPEVLPLRQVVLLSAVKGQFKTFLALDMALGVATGKKTCGVVPLHTGLVFYGDHESMEGIAKFHRPAWHHFHDIDQKAETGFYLMQGPRAALEVHRQEFEAQINYRQNIEKRPVRLIVFDTYSKCMMGLDENDASDANDFIGYCKALIDKYGCTVLILAHIGKDSARGPRGSSALPYGVDSVLELERQDEKSLQVRMYVRHHRSAPVRQQPFCFEGRYMDKSLVFDVLGPEQQAALTAVYEEFDRRRVVGTLRSLGATTDDAAVTPRALASALALQGENESNGRYEARVTQAELTLRRLSRTKPFEGLAFGRGTKMLWSVPDTEGDA